MGSRLSMLSLGIKRECVSEKPRKKAMALRRAPLSVGAGEDIPSSTDNGSRRRTTLPAKFMSGKEARQSGMREGKDNEKERGGHIL